MKKILLLLALLVPMIALVISCGNSSPTSSNSGSSNPTSTPTSTPTPSVKTIASTALGTYSGGVSVEGMAVDSSDNLYIANFNGANTSSNLMKVNPAGTPTNVVAMNGISDVAYDGTNWYACGVNSGSSVFFYNGTTVTTPSGINTGGFQGIAVNSAATTMALVSGSAVTLYSLPSFTSLGNVTTSGSALGYQDLAWDNSGNLYVGDGTVIVKYTPGVSSATTVAGQASSGYYDGAATTTARFTGINAITVDKNGNIYVGDNNGSVREVSNGTVSTLIGPTGTHASPQFTSPTLNYPRGIAVDNAGNVFIANDNGSPNDAIYEYIP